ncbi:5-formyltetrahydrofolate cyclo-ligase [Alishewanella sp. HL-SH06]|uniref:5-formyltetrahydrofolate cyclo-ligase n=1 Tax=Alishewanella sp. HL-SH06 TaxID=3461144 RepID=UPI0040427429
MLSRQQLRTEMRQRRQALSAATQHSAALALCQQILSQPDIMRQQHFALYLSNDAEINTSPLINTLLNANKQLYLPVLHPFVSGYLLFQHYLPSMPMRTNKFGIAEPVWHCQHIKPVAELDVIFTPLVAFDDRGQRLGMGGGFYDRTLAPLNHLAAPARTPQLIGLAHNCQQWPELPIAPWDQPMAAIATPSHFWRFNAD